ncbi:MAG: hypothetical protein HC866_17980 [Leptolyngbyaceae cyanobacterium RU_5_1]|nr:hypothetical protein [Leptolyngbyaceae cyanobacterium RU_5_1]
METAISISDSVFYESAAIAKRLGISRNELYTQALKKFIATHNRQQITEQLNEYYSKHPSPADPVLSQMQFASLPREDW